MPEPVPFPSIEEVQRIAALNDPAERNREITRCYQRLSLAMTPRSGMRANWCSFAAWASRQAGESIRKEDLPRRLAELKAALPFVDEAAAVIVDFARRAGLTRDQSVVVNKIWEIIDPAGALERSSLAVGRGNQKVFAEIGLEFARFYAACLDDAQPDPVRIEAFCASLRPGDPPDGQAHLRTAFDAYYRAFFEPDPGTRAGVLLFANLSIGFHEQTRLQPEIAAAMQAGLPDPPEFTERLIEAVFGRWGWYLRAVLFVVRRVRGKALLDRVVERLVNEARREMRPLLTATMMTIGLPGGRVALGRDLQGGFPPELAHIADPALQALLAQVDPTPDSLQASGAVDWADLPDRLHFIADLFRRYAADPGLFQPPEG